MSSIPSRSAADPPVGVENAAPSEAPDAIPNRSTRGDDMMNAKFLAEGLLVLVCMVALNAGLTKWLAGPAPASITTTAQKAPGPHTQPIPAAKPAANPAAQSENP